MRPRVGGSGVVRWTWFELQAPTLAAIPQRIIDCPHADVRARTGLRRQLLERGYFKETDTEVSMLLVLAAILLIIAVVGGVAIHPLLFLIAILAVLALVGGLRA